MHTAAARGSAVLQIGLPHRQNLPAVTPAAPHMAALPLSGVLQNLQTAEPPANPILERRRFRAATARFTAGQELIPRGLHDASAIAPAFPEHAAVFGALFRLFQHGQPPEAPPHKRFLQRRRTPAAFDDAGLQPAAFHKHLAPAVTPAAPHHRPVLSEIHRLQSHQLAEALPGQVGFHVLGMVAVLLNGRH